MATTSQEDPSDKSTLYNTCKEKVKTFVEEWSNNFKMCYCPCKINKYGMMDSDDTDNETPVPLTRGDDEEDTHKMEVCTSGEQTKTTSSKRPPILKEVPVEGTGSPQSRTSYHREYRNPALEQAAVTVETTGHPTLEQATVTVETTGSPIVEQATVTVETTGPPTVEQATVTVDTTGSPTLEQLQDLNVEPIHFQMLGFYLQVGQEKLNEIGRSLDSTSDALTEVYRVWLERGVNVTWECIVQALEECQLMDKAQHVRSKYLH